MTSAMYLAQAHSSAQHSSTSFSMVTRMQEP
jgi:hypothetical protein